MVMSCLSNEARVSYPILMLTGLKLVETSGGWIVPIEYSEVRKGMVIVGEDKQLYTVVDRNLHTPGNWRAILTLKMKNLNTGAVTINRFKPEDKVEQAYLDNRPCSICTRKATTLFSAIWKRSIPTISTKIG